MDKNNVLTYWKKPLLGRRKCSRQISVWMLALARRSGQGLVVINPVYATRPSNWINAFSTKFYLGYSRFSLPNWGRRYQAWFVFLYITGSQILNLILGRGWSTWDEIRKEPGRIRDGSNPDEDIGGYAKWKEDIQHIKNTGVSLSQSTQSLWLLYFLSKAKFRWPTIASPSAGLGYYLVERKKSSTRKASNTTESFWKA